MRSSVVELENKVSSMINIGDYEKNIQEISRVKNEINRYNDAIETALFKKNKIEEILSKESDDQDTLDESILYEFYKDVEHYLGNIDKEFQELIEFNNSIKKNKLTYYRNRLNEINLDISNMNYSRESIINENKKIISIIDQDNFKNFEKIHKELISQSEQLGQLTKILDIYNELTEDLNKKTNEYGTINDGSIVMDNLSKFNEYLTKISYETFGQRLYLTRADTFPLKLSNVDDGLGTGHRKSITLLLDIAYVSFIKELKLDFPRFFVHDVLETVAKHNLEKIVSFINENESQFIFAILNEKIQKYQFINENDKILRLSKEDKLFKI